MDSTTHLNSPDVQADIEEEALGCFNLAHDLLTECKAAGNINDLDTSIYLLFQAAYSLFLADAQLPECLNCLSVALATRFSYTGSLRDVIMAIVPCVNGLDAQALSAVQADLSPVEDDPEDMMACASAIFAHFNQAVDPETLDNVIFLHQEALPALPHPQQWKSLYELSDALLLKYRVSGDVEALQEAVSLLRQLCLLQPNRWSSLCAALLMAGTATNDPAQMHEAAGLVNKAEKSDEGLISRISGTSCVDAFRQSGNLSDLEAGISQLEEAEFQLSWGHSLRGTLIENLATAIQIRFEEQGNPQDIDQAMQLHHQVLALHPEARPNDSVSLHNLANIFRIRSEHRGDPEDIGKAIQLNREALALRPSPHPDRGISLRNLAGAILVRFEQQGDPQDIDEAVQLQREALTLCVSSHRDHIISLNNLATILSIRFEQRGNLQDIDEAVQLFRESLTLCPSTYPNYGMTIHNLAKGIQTRFEKRGDPQDLDEAVHLFQEALILHPSPHPGRGLCLTHLASIITTRFEQLKDPQNINEAVRLHQEALALCPSPHPRRETFLNHLARAVMVKIQFDQQENPQERDAYDDMIQLLRESLALHPSPHPERGVTLSNLAMLLFLSYTHWQDPDRLEDAMSLFQEGSLYLSSSPLVRFKHTHTWAEAAADSHHPSSLPAYRGAISLLPQLAALHLDMRSRHQLLTTLRGSVLASGAATCAVDLGEYEIAVELLETSRSVFWSQALHLRTPLDTLRTDHPQLASQISALATELEKTSFRDPRDRCLSLNKDWEQAIASVRMLSGFEDFMQPKGIKALQEAALHGPIVILNAGKSSSHALLVKETGEVQCVPLPDMSLPLAEFLVELLQALRFRSTFDIIEFIENHSHGANTATRGFLEDRLLGGQEVLDKTTPNDVFRRILAGLWRSIVKPALDVLNFKKSANPPRLWWCPVGPLTFLPIHAAGLYGKDNTDCVSDYVISSYTPTLTALIDPPNQTTTPFKMSAIIQPESEFSPLPETRTELKRIRERVPKQWLTALGDTEHATVETSLFHLRESSIVHFACHGKQDESNPLDSGLVLTDGLLKVSEIMRKPDTDDSSGIRKSMALAFLSACETAKGDDKVPDEAMHLAATLLFSGFRGVVATMWSMNDLDGPKVADTFYEHLFRNCDPTLSPPIVPDLTEAARALHLAVTTLRRDPDIPFMRWVPFVHYGL
ncbi:CHAT domain-containing protein [Mycena epipterygia]|nr:CHAT domain-containing protein [Mycena epipterygia]